MADYHVTRNNEHETVWDIVYHIPIPNTNNTVGYSVRTIVADEINQKDESGVPTSSVPWISAQELAQIQAGELWETVERLEVGSGTTLAEKRAFAEARYNDLVATDRLELLTKYNYYGYDGTVA